MTILHKKSNKHGFSFNIFSGAPKGSFMFKQLPQKNFFTLEVASFMIFQDFPTMTTTKALRPIFWNQVFIPKEVFGTHWAWDKGVIRKRHGPSMTSD